MDRQSFFSECTRTRVASRTRALRRFSRVLLALIPFVFAPITAAHAQGGTVSGVVLDRNQTPLSNAQVTVRGTQLGTQTDANGRFRISGISGSASDSPFHSSNTTPRLSNSRVKPVAETLWKWRHNAR